MGKLIKSLLIVLFACSICIAITGIHWTEIGKGVVFGNVEVSRGTIIYDEVIGVINPTFMKIVKYTDEEAQVLLDAIKKSEEWKELPLPPNVYNRMYGNEVYEGYDYLEEVENGYYYFENKNNESSIDLEEGEFPYNYCVCIYDMDNKVLYYFSDNS